MLYLAGILLVIGISIALVAAFRSWAFAIRQEDADEGITLGQAREMRASGLLTEQEFDQVKRAIIESTGNRTGGGNAESAI